MQAEGSAIKYNNMSKQDKHEKRHEGGSHEPKTPQKPNKGDHKKGENIPQNVPKKPHSGKPAPKKKYDQ